jgi:hypothetical protein
MPSGTPTLASAAVEVGEGVATDGLDAADGVATFVGGEVASGVANAT